QPAEGVRLRYVFLQLHRLAQYQLLVALASLRPEAAHRPVGIDRLRRVHADVAQLVGLAVQLNLDRVAINNAGDSGLLASVGSGAGRAGAGALGAGEGQQAEEEQGGQPDPPHAVFTPFSSSKLSSAASSRSLVSYCCAFCSLEPGASPT